MRGEIVIRTYCMKNCIFNKNLKRFFILGLCAFLLCLPSYPVFSWNRYIIEKTCKFSSLFINCAILNFFYLIALNPNFILCKLSYPISQWRLEEQKD